MSHPTKQRVSIGLVGGGEIAKAHVLAYAMLPILYGPDLVPISRLVVGEKDETLARSAAQKLGFNRWSVGWQEISKDQDVDLVDVVTPPFLHKGPVIDAVEHGKNVFCEKPLASYASDAREIYDAAKRAGVIHMVGFNHRRLPAVAFAKSLIDSGYVGKLYQLRCQYHEDFALNPLLPLMWRFRSKMAHGGAILEMGSHLIDLLRHFVGEEPKAVSAVSRTLIEERTLETDQAQKGRVDVDDVTTCLLRFGNGAIAQLGASWAVHGRKAPHFEFEVNGSEGSIFYNLERPHELQVYSGNDRPDLQGYTTIVMGPAHQNAKTLAMTQTGTGFGFEDSFISEMHDLVEAVAQDRQVTPSFYDGWKTALVADAIIESSKKESWVEIG